jgi:hypothetical protein
VVTVNWKHAGELVAELEGGVVREEEPIVRAADRLDLRDIRQRHRRAIAGRLERDPPQASGPGRTVGGEVGGGGELVNLRQVRRRRGRDSLGLQGIEHGLRSDPQVAQSGRVERQVEPVLRHR